MHTFRYVRMIAPCMGYHPNELLLRLLHGQRPCQPAQQASIPASYFLHQRTSQHLPSTHACTWFTRQQVSIFTSSCRHRLAARAVVSPTRHAGFHPCVPFASPSKPTVRHRQFHATAPEYATSSLVLAVTRPFPAMTITLSALSHAKDIPLVLHLNNHTKSSLVWL